MSEIFSGCFSLLKIPDISKWNTNKVYNMSGMFNGCSSLLIIPDISTWKTDNLSEIDLMFYGCSSLITNPDISKWNFNKIKKEEFLSSSKFCNSEIIELSSYFNNKILLTSDNSISTVNNNSEEYIKKNIIYNNILDYNNSKGDELNDYYNNFYN